jgi:AcrR family transcriptional regulator
MESSAVLAAPRGRPREFDPEEALAAALRVFWARGYEGASLTELTEAMGITRPSLYACFGNKEALFNKALDLYESEKLAFMARAIEAPTARGVAEALLMGGLQNQMSNCDPKGCLGVISSVACGAEAEPIKQAVIARRKPSEAALINRFQRAIDEGDLPPHVDPAGVARYVIAILQGVSVQAGSGATNDDLRTLVDTALAMWPSR